MRLTGDVIRRVIDLLQDEEYIAVSDTIEVAKGRYYMPKGFRKLVKLLRRYAKWQKKSLLK